MSYFSDTSSTCSAPPLTPSPYHPSGGPDLNAHAYSSPTPYDSTSPPASLRNYSSALMRQMSAGLTAAMKDLKDDRGGPERKFDVEYGYDEDPIERHVRLFLTPRKVLNENQSKQSKALPELGLKAVSSSVPPPSKSSQPHLHSHSNSNRLEKIIPASASRPLQDSQTNMMDSTERYSSITEEDKFRPGLIHFHRSNSTISSSSSSLQPPRPGFSRMDSNMSTNSTISIMSEDSFEAIKAEDIVSMYGGFHSNKEDPFEYDFDDQDMNNNNENVNGEEELEIGLGRSSILSTDTTNTIKPNQFPQSHQYNTYTQPRLSPALVVSTSHHTHHQQQRPATLPSRPSFTRKRSRVHPYENPAHNGLTPLVNNDHNESHSPNLELEVPAWLADRTISEQMVAQAGLRCQRQRAGVVRR